MPVGDAKTEPTDQDASSFIASLPDRTRREDAEGLVALMAGATGERPVLWGSGMVGFGTYHYRYASGREGDWFKVGFAARSKRLTIYLLSGLVGYDDLLARLGTFARGKSCLYVRRLDDVDRGLLDDLVRRCVAHIDQVEADLGAIPRMSEMPPPKL